MADTARTLDAFLNASTGLFRDNTSGDISAQDLRDFVQSSYQPQGLCDFRLGLEQDVPVSTTDQTSKDDVFVNAVGRGNRLGLSDGTYWLQTPCRPFALGNLSGLTSGRNYDVFAAYSVPTHSSTNTGTDVVTWSSNPGWTTGTYVICLSSGSGLTAGTPYWYSRASATTGSFHTTLANALAGTSKVDLTGNVTNSLVGVFADLGPTWNTGSGSDTARGTGAGSTALTTLDGVYVNAASVTGSIGGGTIAASAGLYLGTVRTTGTAAVEDSGATANAGGATPKRFVWNAYNQVVRPFRRVDTTSSWTLNTGSYRSARGSDSNRIEMVVGLAGQRLNAAVVAYANITSSADSGSVALAEDSTTTPHANNLGVLMPNTSNALATLAWLRCYVPLGYHYYQWIEKDNNFGAGMTFYGSDTFATCGITGDWAC